MPKLKTLAVTITGYDRRGLVEALAQAIKLHGANWTASRMSHLGGQFAGIVMVDVPITSVRELKAALKGLEKPGLAIVIVDDTAPHRDPDQVPITLDLLGQDRPGIIHEVANILTENKISIESIETRTLSASWSGEWLFRARIDLRLPQSLSIPELRGRLEKIANELMIDIELDHAAVTNFHR